jgi:hypothetical protein
MQPLIFASVEELVGDAGLAMLIGSSIGSVERRPLDVAHFSGNSLERVIARQHGMEHRFVLKRFAIERDWIMRLTHDHAVREVALYRHGVFARMPNQCHVPVVAAARDGDSWASLMTDVSTGLPASTDAPIAMPDLRRYLAHLAAVHARFLGDDTLLDPALGLSSVRDFVLILAPTVVRNECAQGRSHPVLEAAQQGWQVFAAIGPSAAIQIVEYVEQHIQQIVELIGYAPRTLVHGDFKVANLGAWPPMPTLTPPDPGYAPRTVMLDWQDATYSAPLLDLGYFLAISALRLPVAKEAAIRIYRDALAACGCAYPEQAWERDLDLGLFAGGAMRLLWQKALGTQAQDPIARQRQHEEMSWWSDVAIRASRWLC